MTPDPDALRSALAEALHDEFWFHDMAHTPDGCGDLELPGDADIVPVGELRAETVQTMAATQR